MRCARHRVENCSDEACEMAARLPTVDVARRIAHDNAPDLRAECRECHAPIVGVRSELGELMLAHMEVCDGNG